MQRPLVTLVGDGYLVPCVDGHDRPYLSLDAAASTSALPRVARQVEEFLPVYSSVHRGAGYKSQLSTQFYEEARSAALLFAGRDADLDTAIICRNTTEAVNHLAYRLLLEPSDSVVTTVVEHHANLLPWRRYARCRYVECGRDGTFDTDDVIRMLDAGDKPRLLAITGASNITGWCPDVDGAVAAAHQRGVPVFVDGAQLAPHRPLPRSADYVAWSGHKMYAPYGAGVLVGPTAAFRDGDPFLAGGGAVDLVDLDEVVWSDPPEREEAGSPNVVGAVALDAAIHELLSFGWDAVAAHDREISSALRAGLSSNPRVRVLGPTGVDLPVATFVVEGMHHALVAARLSAEHGIGIRHGCFCAHPYLVRLLGLTKEEIADFRDDVRRQDRTRMPGALRASGGLSTGPEDVERFLRALASITEGAEGPVPYLQDAASGEFFPDPEAAPWYAEARTSPACGRS